MPKKSDSRERIIIGLIEQVQMENHTSKRTIQAKIDTGATKSSVDEQLARDLSLGPVIKSKYVKSASGNKLRPVVEATLTLAGKTMTAEFTIADRSHLSYPVLIGQNVLKQGFLIDPQQ